MTKPKTPTPKIKPATIPKSRKPDCCNSCGHRWLMHDGIERTCEQLLRARESLRVIKAWARLGLIKNLQHSVTEVCELGLRR